MTTRNAEFLNETPGRGSAATIYFTNAINIGEDGWAMVAPIGDHPSLALTEQPDGRIKKQMAIQRITKASAEGMVAEFNNSRKGLRKFFKGLPIYVGHPDGPGMEKRYPDKEPKGIFAVLAVREDGLYGQPVFTNAGSALVDGQPPQFKAFSSRLVESNPDGELDGKPVFTPTKIVSVGLTNHPQLPVHFFNADDTLADAAENKPTINQNMKKKLKLLCTALGIQFANESDDAATEVALDQVQAKVTEFTNSQSSWKKKLIALAKSVGIEFANEEAVKDVDAALDQVEAKVKVIAADVARLTNEVGSAKTAFANERSARIGDLLGAAITTGRITAAEKPDWERRLGNPTEFANESAALGRLTAKVKTTSVTLKRGEREVQVDVADASARRQFINEVSAEIATEQKLHPVRNARQIAALVQQRHPALFRETPHVEIKHAGSKR